MAKKKIKKQKIRTTSASTQQAAKSTGSLETKIKKRFSGIYEGKEIYWVWGLLFLLAFFLLKDFLLLQKTMLYKDIGSDTINVYYPVLVQLSDMWKQGVPQWSFSQGMGQNLYPFLGWDIFTWVYYFFDKDGIAIAISFVHFFKILSAGILFYYYLKTLGISKYSSLLGAVLFAFCAYMTIGICWFTYSTEAIYFIFFLLAFEKFFKQNIWYLLPIAVAIIAASSPFSVYLSALFIFFYAIVRYVEEGRDIKKIGFFFLKLAGLGLVGIALSSVFFFSQVLQILESPRGSGDVSYASSLSSNPIFASTSILQGISFIFRTFSTDILGTGNDFQGWTNYLESPLTYTGLVSLLLAPQIFIFVDKKRKILYGACILLFIIPVVFPFFRYMLFLFQGDYFRTLSLFMSVGVLFLSIQALNFILKKSRINLILLIGTLVTLLILLYYPYFNNGNPVDNDLRNVATFFLVINSGILYFLSTSKSKLILQLILFLSVSVEVVYFSGLTVNKRDVITNKELKEKTGYNDYTVDAVAYLKSNDHSFYRINKYYSSGPAMHGSLNDADVQQYYGTRSYLSFNQLNYIHFLQEVNIIDKKDETASRWATGLISRPILQSFASVKYTLSKDPSIHVAQLGFDSLTTFGNVSVYKNRYSLPLGFTYDKYIPSQIFSGLSTTQMDLSLLKAFVIDNDKKKKFKDFSSLDLKDTTNNFTFNDYSNYTSILKADTLKIIEQSNNIIKGTINLKNKKLLFFSIPFDKGWAAVVDGKKTNIEMVNIGFMGLLLDKGEHTVELKYSAPLMKEGAIASAVSICLFLFFIWFSQRRKSKSEIPKASAKI